MLNPEFPVVQGKYQITENWSIELPAQFNRRNENDHIVIWDNSLTLWLIVYDNPESLSPYDYVTSFAQNRIEQSFDEIAYGDDDSYMFAYKSIEMAMPESNILQENEIVENTLETISLTTYTAVKSSIILCNFYYENPTQSELADFMWKSLEFREL